LDLARFADLTAQARQLRDRDQPELALALLHAAEALWHGDPLADLPQSPLWTAVLHPLAERRLTARQDRLCLQLATGDAEAAIAELRGLVAEHPLREGLWAQLISALHTAGRRAEALDAYATLRRTLADELGVEPGIVLHRLHLTLLGDLDGAAGRRESAGRVPPVCLLPADLPDFTGRDGPLATLLTHLTTVRPAAAVPPVAVISGPPGVGKSALAVHVGHAVRQHFPDGRLYLDLGGTDDRPRAVPDLLGELLRTLGTAAEVAQASSNEMAARCRARLTGRRILLVLDNAASADQVRPLLPACGGCAVLVTSRSRLTELPGARQVELEPLTPAETHELLAAIAGRDRVAAEPEAAAEIVRACAGLPLAVRIAGAKLAARRAWPLRILADRLADESRRLGELRIGRLGVDTSIDVSYRQLPPDAALAYRRLALWGATAFPAWVVDAALCRPSTDTAPDRRSADAALDALVDANLVQLTGVDPTGQPGYRLHDLLLLYARQAAADDPPTDRTAVIGRVVGGWLALVERATTGLPAHVFTPGRRCAQRWHPHPDATRRLLADPLAWLDAQRPAIVASVGHAAAYGLDDLAWELAIALVPYLDLRSHLDEWQLTHRLALTATTRAGNRYGQAALLRGLGQLNLYRDGYRAAADAFTRAASLYRILADERGEASALSGLGAVHRIRGAYERALACLRRALAIFVRVGDQHGEAYARGAIGIVWLAREEYGQAREWLNLALRLAEATSDRHRLAHVRHQLGLVHLRQGDADRARGELERALAEFETIGDRQGTAYALQGMGELAAEHGDRGLAAALLDRALGIVGELGDRRAEASVCRMLGRVHRAAGHPILARTHLARARALSRSLS
jgi:tetratricopeptide (TPR) repeat protein